MFVLQCLCDVGVGGASTAVGMQRDCSKAFNKHTTEEKLSIQIHREIKGCVWLNQAQWRNLDISLQGNWN